MTAQTLGERPGQANARLFPPPREDGGTTINYLGIGAPGRDRLGAALLTGSSILIAALAVAMAYVSISAQFAFINSVKADDTASWLQALGLDAAMIASALLALAQARLGMSAKLARIINLTCVAGSLLMNVLAAPTLSVKDVITFAMPALLYAALSDLLIGVVRRITLKKEDAPRAQRVKGTGLWLIRFGFRPISTVKGFRSWTETLPSSPAHRSPITVTAHLERSPLKPDPDHDDRSPITDERSPLKAITTTDHDDRSPITTVSAHRSPLKAVTDQGSDRSPLTLVTDHGGRSPITATDHVSAQLDDVSAQLARVIDLLTDDRSLSGRVIGETLGKSEATGRRLKRDALKLIESKGA